MIEKWEEKYADVMEHELVTSQQIQRWQNEEIELLRAEVEWLKAELEERQADIAAVLSSVHKAEADAARMREALEKIAGSSMSMYATYSDALENRQDVARAARAALNKGGE